MNAYMVDHLWVGRSHLIFIIDFTLNCTWSTPFKQTLVRLNNILLSRRFYSTPHFRYSHSIPNTCLSKTEAAFSLGPALQTKRPSYRQTTQTRLWVVLWRVYTIMQLQANIYSNLHDIEAPGENISDDVSSTPRVKPHKQALDLSRAVWRRTAIFFTSSESKHAATHRCQSLHTQAHIFTWWVQVVLWQIRVQYTCTQVWDSVKQCYVHLPG